jgi:hypothetical protein
MLRILPPLNGVSFVLITAFQGLRAGDKVGPPQCAAGGAWHRLCDLKASGTNEGR